MDAGSARTRCVIGAIENGGIRYLAHGLAPSAGWLKGRMSDPVAVAESIRAAVTDAERGAQVSVDSVTLGIGGMEVRGAQSRGLYEFGRPHELDSGDLEYAVEMACRRPSGARSHVAARAAAAFHAGRAWRIPASAEEQLFAPGSSRSHRDRRGA